MLKALDLFCGAGGATKGLQMAGFQVTGIDINPQPRYCGDHFIQEDVMAMNGEWGEWDLIWASPPCQAYSAAMKHLAAPKPKLIEPIRAMLSRYNYVIENVVGAPLHKPHILCGSEFNMRVHRHRLFEAHWLEERKPKCVHTKAILNPHRAESRERFYAEFGRQDPEKFWAKEMGVGWMNRQEARESIPPAYSHYIAQQFLKWRAERCV